jgi:hypothetical protein
VRVDDAHCGWNYVLGGGAFYAAVVPAADGFPPGCTVTITNADLPACKGKSIRVAGIAEPFVLWPGQSVKLAAIETAWTKIADLGRWRPDCGGITLTVHTDSTNGSDKKGETDGLDAGAEAFKSVQFALHYVLTVSILPRRRKRGSEFSWHPEARIKLEYTLRRTALIPVRKAVRP